MKEKVNIDLIINGVLKGDPKFQKSLFLKYYALVLSITRRYMHSQTIAEEVVNDVFLKVFNKVSLYNTNYPFSNWLIKITINTCIDRLKIKKNQVKMVELKEEMVDYSDDAFLAIVENEDSILPIIQELPPQYKLVFNLYVFEEYKHKEIAELLNISINTSKSNLHKAKKIILNQILNNPNYKSLKSKAV